MPFVVQLLGEYVVEIAEAILQRIQDVPSDPYRRFAGEDEPFLGLTRQRVVSYWACNYAERYRLAEYPPLQVMKQLQLWNGREGRRRMVGMRRVKG
jgi:hypothetical protein